MEPIEIRFEDLHYIINVARTQLRNWYKKFNEESDRIKMQKCETILQKITECDAMDFVIIEKPF